MDVDLDAVVEELKQNSYPQLADMILNLQAEHSRQKKETALTWADLQLILRRVVPQKLEADGQINTTVVCGDGVNRRLQTLDQVSVKTPAGNKPQLWAWLKAQGAPEMITETVNASTLSAFVRERIKQGEELPTDICEIDAYTVASLVKA